MSRVLAYGVGLGVLALVAAKGFDDPSDDSYPLSTYPMFARPRDKPFLNFAEGVDALGRPVRLTPALIASGEVMQAVATVRRAVEAGPEARSLLCRTIALRVASSAEQARVVEVRLVGASFDPVRYFVEGPHPEGRVVHVQCPVSKGAVPRANENTRAP